MWYVTSDSHSDYDKLHKLIKKIQLNEGNNILIHDGDFLDRGPKPWETYTLLRNLEAQGKVKMIMGNHDFWVAQFIYDRAAGIGKKHYYYNTIDVLSKQGMKEQDFLELADWIMTFPLQKEINVNETRYLLAHAATSDDHTKDDNYYLMGYEDFLIEDNDTAYISIVGHTPTPKLYWELGKDYLESVIYHSKNGKIIDVDTGCQTCTKGRLGCICLDTGEEYYA